MVVLALKNTKFSGLHDNFVRFVSLQLIEILGALKKKKSMVSCAPIEQYRYTCRIDLDVTARSFIIKIKKIILVRIAICVTNVIA